MDQEEWGLPLVGMTLLPPRATVLAVEDAVDDLPRMAVGGGLASRIRVLLVEDDEGDAVLVEYALRQSRAPIFTVARARLLSEAFDLLAEGRDFDVVLLDLSLPDSSGISTLTRLQAVAPRLPVVIMTGLDDPQFANYALEVGAQDYLVKSDDPERTVARSIRYAISRMNARIERDALAERVVSQQRTLLKELEVARAMQFDLLPRPERLSEHCASRGLEVEAAFEPSSGIGGDLWGCLDCGPGRMGFYTFDFSGHGIGAALNVFRLHALIADRWRPDMVPADFLAQLASVLPGLLSRGQYATMFLGIVDTAASELRWASAAAPAPILIDGDGARPLDSRGTPLGLNRASTYVDRRHDFPPGATLLLYSDALTDTPAGDGASFGEENLLGLVRDSLAGTGTVTVRELLDAFLARVAPPLPDDLTMLRVTRAMA